MDAMVRELALHERSPELVEATEEDLHRALFGEGGGPGVHAHVAEVRTGGTSPGGAGGAGSSADGDGDEHWAVVGMAVWYVTYSTWTGRHGMWLEDLYVRPTSRGLGLGRALLAALARVCTDRGYRRLEWWVLDWNAPAQGVYRAVGAVAQEEWTTWRLDGDALRALGDGADPLPADPSAPVDGPVDAPLDRPVQERIDRPRSEPGPGA